MERRPAITTCIGQGFGPNPAHAVNPSGCGMQLTSLDMVWLAAKTGQFDRTPVVRDAAIQFRLLVKMLFGLPLRQTTGMVASIVKLAIPNQFCRHFSQGRQNAFRTEWRAGDQRARHMALETIAYLGDDAIVSLPVMAC